MLDNVKRVGLPRHFDRLCRAHDSPSCKPTQGPSRVHFVRLLSSCDRPEDSHSLVSAHCRTSRWPFDAASEQVSQSHGAVSWRSHSRVARASSHSKQHQHISVGCSIRNRTPATIPVLPYYHSKTCTKHPRPQEPKDPDGSLKGVFGRVTSRHSEAPATVCTSCSASVL